MYSSVARILGRYWLAYGGRRALVRSPYLHIALILLGLTFHLWTKPDWWETTIAVLPNLLGFTLGGFAIFISAGDDRFRSSLAEPDDTDPQRPSVFMGLCATFVHFILVQVLALTYAIVAKSWWFYAEWADPIRPILPALNMAAGAVGFGLFLYALTSVVAATLHVLRIAHMFEQFKRFDRP